MRHAKNAGQVTDAELRAAGDGERLLPIVTEPTPEPVNDVVVDDNEWTVDALSNIDWASLRWDVPDKVKSGDRPCMCNRIRGAECDLRTKSRFSIGHDARIKSRLQHAFRNGKRLEFAFEADDRASVLDEYGHAHRLIGEIWLEADVIARLVAPKLLPHVTHVSRAVRLQALDRELGTIVPQTAAKPDAELTDADVAAQVDDAPADSFI
jgi:hypothetical protein